VGRILAARLRARPEDPWALLYQGLFRSYAGENVPENQYVRAVQGFRREGDEGGLVPALLSQLGQRCFGDDRCDALSLDLLEEAERISERGDDLHLRRLTQLWWLRWGIKQDDVALAERAVQRLDALPGQDPPWMVPQLYAQKAFLAGTLRAFEQKLSLYSELLGASPPGSAQHATALGGEAAAAASLALRGTFDRAEAEQLLRAAIAEQDRLGLRVSLTDPGAGSLATRAHLALLLGPTPESLQLVDEALAAYASEPGWTYPWYAYWLKACSLSDGPTPRLDAALEAADAAVQRASGPSSAWEHARSVLMRASVRWRAGQREAARTDALVALEALEELRRRQGDAQVRMRYEDTQAFAYELIAGSLLDHPGSSPSDPEIGEALSTMERLRARGLLESLVRGPSAPGELQRSIQAAHERLLDPRRSGPERGPLVVQLRSAEREHARRRSAGFPDSLPGLPAPSVDALQRALQADEALISFQQWTSEPDVEAPYEAGASWAIVLTREQRRAVRIPGARELETQAKLWLSLLDRRDGSDAAGGARLSQQLLAPVLEVLPGAVSALVIIPDGILHRMPLEALPVSPGGPFLAERFQVSIAPSAAVWLQLRSAPARRGGLALALADPILSPRAREELERLGPSSGFALPHSRDEAARALRAFPAGSRLLVGEEATEENLARASLSAFSLLHVASHALVDVPRPERSALVLGSGGSEDGLLTVEEISRHLRVDRALVVLGACRTSSGALRRGEGTLSLARAFFEAGARSVIGNLTAVRDEESAALFASFYRRIERGEPAGTALALAKRERIGAGAPTASWASYVLLGDSRTVPREPGPNWRRALSIGLLLLSFALVAWLGRRRWARRTGTARE
jgi:CHAT domain-containing protein